MSGPDTQLNGLPTRGDWPRALMALPRQQVADTVDSLCEGLDIRLTSLPAAGLGLLKFKDSALSEPFYLGEFPVATASVELSLADGTKAVGAAQLMDDDASFATSLAIADALLANAVLGSDNLMELVVQGLELIEQEKSVRNAVLSSTKVDFSLLSMAQENDDE